MCMQMLDWMHTMVEVGEAFSGAKAVSLREAVAVQSGRFFKAFHATNMQAGPESCSLDPTSAAPCECLLWMSCSQ